ncbi:hypothetical protein NQ318_011550 [Aromia moschata]|uniref:Uncharacterized protein n=1 Tax=Aromia moschata TaxID=1265417 RepID=A0AAV8Z6V8_9CUCU|nr:hypothetical protein NQ318_011550 [Aromia moschata]
MKNAQESIKKKIYEEKVAPKGQKPNFMTIEEGIRKVREGFFAFHVELTNGYKVVSDTFLESEKCSLREMEYSGIQKIQEYGIQQREANRIYTKKPKCDSHGSNFGSVGLVDCYSAFFDFRDRTSL